MTKTQPLRLLNLALDDRRQTYKQDIRYTARRIIVKRTVFNNKSNINRWFSPWKSQENALGVPSSETKTSSASQLHVISNTGTANSPFPELSFRLDVVALQGTKDNYMEEESASFQVSSLSDGQERLSLLNLFSGSLSVVGSMTIVFKIVKHREKTTPYDRIMFGLSVTDIIASVTYAMAPFLLPADTSQRVWASGNDATCSMLGWFSQFSFSAVWYNAMLSYYYLLTVRFKVSRTDFAQKYEKWVRGSAILFFVATATAGSVFDWYQEFQINQGCWIGEIPKGCEAAGTCTGIGQIVGWIFGGFPMLFTFLSLIVNNLVIFFHVRSMLSNAPSTTITSSRDSSSKSFSSRSSSNNPSSMMEAERVLRQQKQVTEVASQGFLYVITFFVSYTPAFIVRVVDGLGRVDSSSESRIFALLVLNALLLPLQGFFNMFVHTRPNYQRFRAAYPELSVFWALRKACFDSDVPRYSQSSLSRVSAVSRSKRHQKSRSAFSSDLDVVREASNEDGSENNSEDMNRSLSDDPSSNTSFHSLNLGFGDSFSNRNSTGKSSFSDHGSGSRHGTGKGSLGEGGRGMGLEMDLISEGSREDSSSLFPSASSQSQSKCSVDKSITKDKTNVASGESNLPRGSESSVESLDLDAEEARIIFRKEGNNSIRRLNMDGSIQ